MRTLRIGMDAALGILIAANLFVGLPAMAETRTWEATGKVTGITGDPSAITGYPVKIGDRFVIKNTFDSALGVVNSRNCATNGWFWNGAIVETEFRVGRWHHVIVSQVFTEPDPDVYNNDVIVYDDCNGKDLYSMQMQDWYGPASSPQSSKIIAVWGIAENSPSSLIESPNILLTPPDIRPYLPLDSDDMHISFDNIGGASAFIHGKLEKLREMKSRN